MSGARPVQKPPMRVIPGVGLYVLLMLCGPSAASGQVVSGRVLDAHTGEVLPAATIHVAGTFQGTITNSDGQFEISPEEWPTDLVVRFLGYRTDTVQVAVPAAITIRLEPAAIELATVVVTGENPAVRIMREVIRRKQIWRAELESYQAQAYARVVFANEEDIVAINESASTAWWARGKGLREIKTGSRDTGNLPFGDALPAAAFMMNLYDDDIVIGGHTLIGVTHPNALHRYEFALLQTRHIDETVVHDIEVRPKNALINGFTGRISVLGSEYAMIDAELQPGKAFLFPPPIKTYEVILRQQFFNFNTTAWLPVDLRAENAIKISFWPLLHFPIIGVDVIGRFTDYQLNVPVPDSLFASNTRMVADSAAMESGSIFGEEGVVVPYTPVETLAYESIDSTLALEDAYAPRGPFGRMIRVQREAEEQRSRLSGTDWPDITPRVRFNRVDGFHGGVGIADQFGRHLVLSGGGGWSAELPGRDQWSYDAAVRLNTDRDDKVDFHVESGYRAATEQTYHADHTSQFSNSIAVLMWGREDYFDYYRMEGVFVSVGLTGGHRPHRVEATWHLENHARLPLTTSFDLRGEKTPQRANASVDEGDLRSIALTWGIGAPPVPVFGAVSGVEYVNFQVEHALAGSDMRFGRYVASAYWRFTTLLKRRLLPATLDLHAVLGLSTGDLPPQRTHIIERGNGYFGPFGTLRAYSGLPDQGRQMGLFMWEHNFRTIPFELLGIWSMAKRGYNVLVFGGHAWIRDSAWQQRHELGVSLSGILGLFRIDVAKPLDEPGVRWGWGIARIF